MRSIVKALSFGFVAFLAACSGSSESEVPQGGAINVENEKGSGGGGGQGPVARTDDEAPKINALISKAGVLSTSAKANLEPVKTSEPTVKDLVGDMGEFQCTYTGYSLTKVPEKFVALNPNADVLWPGSLVQGKSMAGGILDPIPVKRASGTITLTLASGGTGSYSKTMERASLSAAMQAQNEILSQYTGATPAKFSYSFQSIYSSEQLAVAVDANVAGTNWAAAAALSVDKSDEKSRFLIQFSQEYFTMAFDPPQGAAGVFDPSVTAEDLAPYAKDGNPPVYVASVTYGRIFYILFESSASQLDLEAAVSGSYSGGLKVDASLETKYKNTINEATVKAYGLGGNAEMAINAVTGHDQFEQIRNFLTTGANFSNTNPGVPISYTIRHLADSSQVRLALTTEYTAKNCIPTATFCDDKGHKLDKCGVCGGDGTSCDDCGGGTVQRKVRSGTYVNFNAAPAPHGTEIAFPDGNYYKYAKALCNRATWGNVRLRCNDGRWNMVSGSVAGDSLCTSDSNANWSSNGNSITTGYEP